MQNSVKNLHIKNRYCTFVRNIDNSVDCLFPANKFAEQIVPELNKVYIWEDDKLLVKILEDSTLEEREYDIPIYALRPLILQDIIMQSFARNMSGKLVFLVDGDKFVDFHMTKLFNTVKFDSETKERESYILQNLDAILDDKFESLREDVVEGCEFVLESNTLGGL